MTSTWIRLIRDESGFVASTEMVLIGTVLVIGMLAGLVAVRDAVASELGDAATVIMYLDHTYSYAPVVTDCGTTAGSVYIDNIDFCTPLPTDDDPPGLAGPIYIGGNIPAQPE